MALALTPCRRGFHLLSLLLVSSPAVCVHGRISGWILRNPRDRNETKGCAGSFLLRT